MEELHEFESWFCNLYDMVASFCHEFEEFKVSVSYVGTSEKKLYSDARKDILLPLMVDPSQQLIPSKSTYSIKENNTIKEQITSEEEETICNSSSETDGSVFEDADWGSLDNFDPNYYNKNVEEICNDDRSDKILHEYSENNVVNRSEVGGICDDSLSEDCGIIPYIEEKCKDDHSVKILQENNVENRSESESDDVFEDADWGWGIPDLNLEIDKIIKEDLLLIDESELYTSIICNENKEEEEINANSENNDSVFENDADCGIIADLNLWMKNLEENKKHLNKSVDEYEINLNNSTTHQSSELESSVTDSFDFDFEDLIMDTVDLPDEKQLVESCVIVESAKLRVCKKSTERKSYKKMIKDAFMPRKSLTKEYKQLAVMHGDIMSQLTDEITPNQDLPDSEWELI